MKRPIADVFATATAMVCRAVTDIVAASSKEWIHSTFAQLAPLQLFPSLPVEGEVDRDIPYGPQRRHRFWFRPGGPPKLPQSILVFVRGGGFVGDDKSEPKSPLYEHIGLWAVLNGLQAFTVSYRLAPMHEWQVGGDDVSLAVEAVIKTVREKVCEPSEVFLMGHSASAVHAAAPVTMHSPPSEIADGIRISGVYDNNICKPNPAYFGERVDLHVQRLSLQGLANFDFPLFLGVTEFDPDLMHSNAVTVMHKRLTSRKQCTQFVILYENNHYRPILLLNSAVDTLAARFLEFRCRHRTKHVRNGPA
ncbi:alpha/beta hydrolase [Paraburkholderia steynii]|uniref:alpha/beta hydrolase n=1 Tax=Paraburkholderia steynii TaxID=1245441 RepID=UPI00141FB11D|nr:alpha/beta hydrolase [Paraburkholderia steynii]